MQNIVICPANPQRDFVQLAAWFTLLEDEISTEASLIAYYEQEKTHILQQAAKNEDGELLGFYWAVCHRKEASQAQIFLYVKPERRGEGIGRRLYVDLERAISEAQIKKLQVNIWDTCPEGRAFAERRGFTERLYRITMALDLQPFDDSAYDDILNRLKSEGFRFTSMEGLGNTQDAQRKLYNLNYLTTMETPGTEGEAPWASFEDFQKSVCQSPWYQPGGQMVVIEPTAGEWVAMSAITRFEGNDYAYNLFTGVDRRFRGRGLGQAVKVLALRYARQVLHTSQVRTHHNAINLPIIAIDRKFGYRQIAGYFLMEKSFR